MAAGMITRIANAMASAEGTHPARREHFRLARVVIEAMHEPTTGMVAAAEKDGPPAVAVKSVWYDMIEHAANEGGDGEAS